MPRDRVRRRRVQHPALSPALMIAACVVIVALPLLTAVVALHSKHWYPVLDLAMTEFRVRDVGGGHTPLIGLPGRIGEYPNQGSHPGPLSFYLLAPVYRLLGSSPWALQVGTVAIHIAAIATALWIGYRRAGTRGVIAVAALLAAVVRGYGQLVLTQPWNPYLPVIAWVVVLLAAWAVLDGDTLMLIPLVVAGSLCAQTHVPYLVPAGALTIGALVVVAWRQRRRSIPIVGAAVAVGVVLWIPPVIDQFVNDPGNVRALLDHFGSPPEDPLGLRSGFELAVAHLDPWTALAGQVTATGRFISPAATWRGGLMLGVWLVSVVLAWRLGPRALRSLHTVAGASFLLGVLAMSRIFGKPWFYLTLWAWGIAAVLLASIVWTAGVAAGRWIARPETAGPVADSEPGAPHRSSPATWWGVGAAAVVVVSLATSISFAHAQVPERRLSDAVEALAGPTYDAVVSGVGAASGPDAPYQVRWSDAADIGSPGFGLLDALERAGLDVAADPYFHVPVTDHRTRPRGESSAQIHLATGAYVDVWRAQPEAVEVATYDPRSGEQRLEYAVTRAGLVDRLHTEGLDDLVDLVDTNLFGAALDPRLSRADRDDMTTLLDVGQPMSVFIAPVDVEPA